jgi:hypothetical protein
VIRLTRISPAALLICLYRDCRAAIKTLESWERKKVCSPARPSLSYRVCVCPTTVQNVAIRASINGEEFLLPEKAARAIVLPRIKLHGRLSLFCAAAAAAAFEQMMRVLFFGARIGAAPAKHTHTTHNNTRAHYYADILCAVWIVFLCSR